ncbi:MAG: tripartite tricarboxylate transporter substrate binding protein [Acidobacteria bacterium]|nr:tripartite tricarboxylate transporter substrate binding protein [Acidobacteriota bacterium]
MQPDARNSRFPYIWRALALTGLTLFYTAAGLCQPRATLKIFVPAAPGGGWDQLGRALQQSLQTEKLASRVTVDNRAGAGGTIGLAQFVTSQKGNTNALLVSGMAMMGAIHMNKSAVSLSQVTPLARLVGEYEVLAVHANSPIRSLRDLVARLKASPGSVSWGGGSAGSPEQILAAMLAQSVGVDPTKVNYIAHSGGGEALASILGGHVTVGLSGYAEFAGQIQAGKLRALAVSSPKRLSGINIPTLKEQGIDLDLANWRAVFGAPGISDAQKRVLIDLLQATVKTPSWRETLRRNDWSDQFLPGDEFKKFLDAEQIRIAKIMERAGLAK